MKNNQTNKNVKHSWQVFTPNYLVDTILDTCGYSWTNILKKHVIDNSCGAWAFVCAFVKRYIEEFQKNSNNKQELQDELSQYIHGIELEDYAYEQCIHNLNQIAQEYSLWEINWNILHDDTLNNKDFIGKMDFVIGNPPYVRVHNLEQSYTAVKQYKFADWWMTDLYLVFFEVWFQMLNKNGRLCYITPSSWLNSVAALNMRKYLYEHKNIVSIIDLGHFQPFEWITTYTQITYCDKSVYNEYFSFYVLKGDEKKSILIDTISYNDILIWNEFYLSDRQTLSMIKKIRETKTPRFVSVKNGFATLQDQYFIQDDFPFQEFVIPVIKWSTSKRRKAYFPYDRNWKPLPKELIFSYEWVAAYLQKYKKLLLKGKSEWENSQWYLYWRTQALKDVFVDKISLNTILIDIQSIKINKVPAWAGVYSWLYIITDFPFNVIESLIKNDDFIKYIKALKKYKSWGYYCFNTKDVELFLNYMIFQDEKLTHWLPSHKYGIPSSNSKLF